MRVTKSVCSGEFVLIVIEQLDQRSHIHTDAFRIAVSIQVDL